MNARGTGCSEGPGSTRNSLQSLCTGCAGCAREALNTLHTWSSGDAWQALDTLRSLHTSHARRSSSPHAGHRNIEVCRMPCLVIFLAVEQHVGHR